MNELLAALPGPLPVKLALLALPMLPNLWGIFHASRHSFAGQKQFVWLGLCVFVPVAGGLLYLFVGQRQAKKPGKAQDNLD